MKKTFTLEGVALAAGFTPDANGKLNLPASTKEECQETGDKLQKTVLDLLHWVPGDAALEVVVTGAGPVWAHLAILHAAHGRAVKYTYSAPNAEYVVFRHGVQN